MSEPARKSNVFKRIEKYRNCKFPDFIKEILIQSGYDCESALLTLNEQSFPNIEKEVNKNKNVLKGTVYEEKLNDNFTFLIGHKAIILSIPETLKKIKNKNKTKTKNPEQLKSELINKIEKYIKNKKLNCVFSDQKIKKLSVGENSTKCLVECTFCTTRTPCTFKTHWEISNFTKHLRGHIGNPPSNPPSQFNQQAGASGGTLIQPRIQRAKTTVLAEVHSVLK